MSRKPVDLTSAVAAPSLRQACWNAIRELEKRGAWTLAQVERSGGVKPGAFKDALRGFIAAGFVESETAKNPASAKRVRKPSLYRLARDVGAEAPRVDRKGNPVPPSGQERMWAAMRILRTFVAPELAMTASEGGGVVSPASARRYCDLLALAGYLRKDGQTGAYTFVPASWSGPAAPMILRFKRVFDPNAATVVWESDPEADEARP